MTTQATRLPTEGQNAMMERRTADRIADLERRAMENVERESRLIAEAIKQAVEVERETCAEIAWAEVENLKHSDFERQMAIKIHDAIRMRK